MDIRRIDDRFSVAPQISPAEVTTLASEGFAAIINNRPDGEEPGQPAGDAVRLIARTMGMDYDAIPVAGGQFTHEQIVAMRRALDEAKGPVLAFCRSGTRSTNLWALAEAKAGGDPDAITAKARAAGYDLTGIRSLLDVLSGKA